MINGADIYADFAGLDRMRAAARDHSPQALRGVAKQFEAFFINMMLKSMRDASMSDSLFDSSQVKFYRQMLDQQLATTLANQGNGIGLAQMLVNQLGKLPGVKSAAGNAAPAAATTDSTNNGAKSPNPLAAARLRYTVRTQSHARSISVKRHAPAHAVAPKPAAAKASGPASSAATLDGTPQTFVQKLLPYARRAARALGVSPAVLLAQAGLETGWGKSVITGTNGTSSKNLFGIKADASWNGARVTVASLEYTDAGVVKQQSSFRAYPSYADSFADYVRFIKDNPRYAEALKQGTNPAAFTEALQQAGYATDPNYADKIQAILNSNDFNEKLAAVKVSAGGPLT